MNSSASVWRPVLEPRPSRIQRIILILFYVLALVAVLQAVMPFEWQVAAVSAWFGLLLYELTSWRHPLSVVLLHERIGDWWLADAEGNASRVSLHRSMVWRYLVVLDFRILEGAGPRRQRVVLFPDSVTADEFRRLRVRLLQGPPPGKTLRE
ncbi:MAG TPA: protein YgfX [Candidatus Kapabacteria bacterium]|nr:protein YgfX [Candidatus Kapabacteria bacterium]